MLLKVKNFTEEEDREETRLELKESRRELKALKRKNLWDGLGL